MKLIINPRTLAVGIAVIALLGATPAMAAKLHLKNCTAETVEARTYNSHDATEAVAFKIRAVTKEGGTATVDCGTNRCKLKLDGNDFGRHGTSHYTITTSEDDSTRLVLNNSVYKNQWVCDSDSTSQ